MGILGTILLGSAVLTGLVMLSVWPSTRRRPRVFLQSPVLEAFDHEARAWGLPCRLPSGELRYQRLRLSPRGLTYDVVGAEVTPETLLTAPSQGTSLHWTFDELAEAVMRVRGSELVLAKTRGALRGHVRLAVRSMANGQALQRAIEQAGAARAGRAMPADEARRQRASLGRIAARSS
ncbi:MAG: hypothetical protein AAF211_05235 [Myxococcota bacterium]